MMDYNSEKLTNIVFESGVLGKSDRQRKLLKFLFDATFSGQSQSVKAYTIATDIFGRSHTFDDQTDSIVRSEMYRLRKNLALFSEQNSEWEIRIPPKSYEIIVNLKRKSIFQWITSQKVFLIPLFGCLALFSSVIWYFYSGGASTVYSAECSTTVPNVRLDMASVISPSDVMVHETIVATFAQYSHVNLLDSTAECSGETPDYRLKVVTNPLESKNEYSFRIYHDGSGETVSTLIFTPDLRSSEIFQVVKFLGENIKPYGLIPRDSIRREWKNETSQRNTECQVLVYDGFVESADLENEEAKTCLQDLYDNQIATADTTALLGITIISNYSSSSENKGNKEYETGRALILEAIKMDETSTLAQMYFLYAEAKNPNFSYEQVSKLATDLETRYSLNPLVLLEVEYHFGHYLGQWEKAIEISQNVAQIHSERDNSVFVTQAAYHLINSDPEQAIQACMRLYSDSSVVQNIILNSCARLAGDFEWYDKSEQVLVGFGYGTSDSRIEVIRTYGWDKSFETKIIEGLMTPSPNGP